MTQDICLGDITPIIPSDLFKVINTEIKGIINSICQDNNIDSKVVFDKGGNIYHGRVQALADAAREAGLDF